MLLLAHYVLVKKVFEPNLSARSIKKTNRIGEDEAFTDVRELHSEKTFKSYNPKKYFEKAAKNDALFFGLDKNRKPLFVPRQRYNKTNIQVSGSMGAGKDQRKSYCLVVLQVTRYWFLILNLTITSSYFERCL